MACNSVSSLDQYPPDFLQIVLLKAAERAEEPVIGLGLLFRFEFEGGDH